MEPVKRKEVFAWAMYDFANSAFATSVLTAVFPLYFSKALVGDEKRGLELWGYLVSGSMFLVALAAPFVGAITDTSGAKKRFLLLFWLSGCMATACLGFQTPGRWVPAAVLFIVANIGFAGGNALYNAFLPELAPREKMDRVSGLGWGLGYLGGGLCLALNLFMIREWEAVGGSLAVVGAWWFLLALPFFALVRERALPVPVEGSRLAYAMRKVFQTLRRVGKFRELSKFLIAYLVYNDGVETVIVMAALVGKTMLRMDDADLLLCLLLIQGVALVGAFCMGWLAERIGSKRALVLSLMIWCGVVVWAALMRTRGEFWGLGVVVGTVLGGTQAISRSLMGKFTPPKLAGEFFGFYAIGGKFSSVLGPLVFSLVSGSFADAQAGVRAGVVSLGVFFLAGLILLLTVREERGIREAEAGT
jgi:UMF1 family MFS transporter